MKKILQIIKLVFVLLICGVPLSVLAKPSFIFILTDDMAYDEFRFMPRTQEYFSVNGVRFTNAFVTQALCCPSRTTILTGRYTKNTGITTNRKPDGGFEGVIRRGLETDTIAVKLKSAGYNTAYFGKYLNEYGTSALVPFNYIPPGWDSWYTLLKSITYYDYSLNENGQVVNYGNTPADYATDVLANHAINHLDAALSNSAPFFMMISPFAPHATNEPLIDLIPVPAPRHLNLFDGLAASRSASFNQADVSRKPQDVRKNPLLLADDIETIDQNFRLRVQSLQAVDEMIGQLIDQLKNHPKGNQTYLIFLSDNGFWFGDHRFLSGKTGLYDQSHHVPFAITGPGVKQGLVRDDLVTNLDILPTILVLASVPVDTNSYDGRSLRPLIVSSERNVIFPRNSFLIETSQNKRNGIRFKTYAYLESPGLVGPPFLELYDTKLDPDQVHNIAARLTSTSRDSLKSALEQLRNCSGTNCRQLENKFNDDLVELTPDP